jgi:hypothetical protein
MPTAIIPPLVPPIPRFTPVSGALTGPADGDPLFAASVNDPFKQLADRTALSFYGLYGVYGSRMNAICSDGLIIEMNFQGAVRSSSGVLSGDIGSPPGSIDIAATLGSAPVANMWYYVYGSDVSGVLTAVISTDPPDETLKYRNSSSDQAFLTAFKTDASADVRPFSHYEGTYSYHGEVSVIARSDPGTLTWATALLPDVPPFARQALVEATIYNIDPLLSASIGFRYPLSTVFKTLTAGINPTTDIQNSSLYILPIDGQNGFEYLRGVTSPGTADVSAVLHGFMI